MTNIAILTVSDTRNLTTDLSGHYLEQTLSEHHYNCLTRELAIDDRHAIQQAYARCCAAKPAVDVVIINGGTGIAKRDVTIPTIAPALVAEIPGFGELFRHLSFADIGTHAMASRAMAGFNQQDQLIFLLPGSTKACELALTKLILPELTHLLNERTK